MKCLMNSFICVLSSDCSVHYILLDVLHCIFRTSRPDMFLLKGVPKIRSKFIGEHSCWSVISIQKICVHILTLFLAFPISMFLASSSFTSGGISSDFIWEERKLKKLWIQVESLTSFFGLPFWAAFTLSILLLIIPFWST